MKASERKQVSLDRRKQFKIFLEEVLKILVYFLRKRGRIFKIPSLKFKISVRSALFAVGSHTVEFYE